MNEPQDDRELEEYLSGQSSLSRRYRELGNEQPPPELDAKILAAARAESTVVPLRRRLQRWAPAIAVAATLLICLSLVIEIALPPAELPPDSIPTPVGPMMPESPASGEILARKAAPPAALSPARESAAAGPGSDAPSAADAPPLAAGRVLQELAVTAAPAEPAPQPAAGEWPDDWPDDRRLAEAIDWIRAQGQTPAAEAVGRAELAAAAGPATAAEPPADAALAAILAAWDAGERDVARERLRAFVTAHPGHPLSRGLTADGDR